MEYVNSINPRRFSAIASLTEGNLWLAHLLDRVLYRCQNSTLTYKGHQAFTEPLEQLRAFVGATSIKSLQSDLRALQTLGVIGKHTAMTDYGKQCFIWLTPHLMAHLPTPADNDAGVVFRQAENIERYQGLHTLLGAPQGKTGFFQCYVLDTLLYLCQREANFQGSRPEQAWLAMKLPSLARYCHLSERTLRRQLATLVEAGWLIKTKKKVSAFQVETRYQVAFSVWQAMKKTVSDPQGKSGQFQQGKSGQFHRDININANINKNNMTACEQPNVLRETCENNEQKSDVILKNEEILPPTTLPLGKRLRKEEGLPLETNLLQVSTLNARQRRYVQGMLTRLTADHGCRFSDPSGLFHEICFALQQVRFIFPARHSFRHRLNLIGKLLREKRWTTPHGYERYDPHGIAQKTKREEKEAAWQAKKSAEGQGGLVRLRSVTAANAPSGPPSAIATRLAEMRDLARRAEATDCSTAARESIIALLQRHQTAIVTEMATQKESGG